MTMHVARLASLQLVQTIQKNFLDSDTERKREAGGGLAARQDEEAVQQ